MSLYSPYFQSIGCNLSSGYTPQTDVASATISAELHDSPDNLWAHTAALVGTISGTVRIAGDPIVGAKAVLMDEATDTPVAYAVSLSDGSFEFKDLNTTMKFYVMVKLPSGWQDWEYMVSSRRSPA